MLVLVQAISHHNENTHLSDYVEEIEKLKSASEIILGEKSFLRLFELYAFC